VSGEGEASATPDIARTNVGVETRAADASQATAQANERMAAVIAAVKKTGVADADLRTHSLSLRFEHSPDQPYPPRAEPPRALEARPTKAGGKAAAESGVTEMAAAPEAAMPAGFYVARNMVEVTVRDLDKVSEVLSAATDAGADQLWGIEFEVEDTEPLIARARELAVQHAQNNAKQLAALTHVELGPVVSVTDGAVSQGGPMPMMAMRAESSMAKNVPVERGQMTVSHQVTLLYRLDESGK